MKTCEYCYWCSCIDSNHVPYCFEPHNESGLTYPENTCDYFDPTQENDKEQK